MRKGGLGLVRRYTLTGTKKVHGSGLFNESGRVNVLSNMDSALGRGHAPP